MTWSRRSRTARHMSASAARCSERVHRCGSLAAGTETTSVSFQRGVPVGRLRAVRTARGRCRTADGGARDGCTAQGGRLARTGRGRRRPARRRSADDDGDDERPDDGGDARLPRRRATGPSRYADEFADDDEDDAEEPPAPPRAVDRERAGALASALEPAERDRRPGDGRAAGAAASGPASARSPGRRARRASGALTLPDPGQPRPGAAGPAARAGRGRPRRSQRYQITTLHPTTYSEARTIGEHFRDGVPVIMNLTEMDEADAKRLVDFAAGLAFGLRGTIERVTNRVFLLSPANVQVTAEDKAKIAEGGFFSLS